MVIYLTEIEINCGVCRRTKKTFNPHTKETGNCLKCRKKADENDRLEFTCYYCNRSKLAETRERMLSNICSNCEVKCLNCKETFNPTYNNTSLGESVSQRTYELRHEIPAQLSPQQEHARTCGRRYCETCADWCLGTLELFNEHLSEHGQAQQAQILQPPRNR